MTATQWEFLFKVEPPIVVVGQGEPERVKWNPSHFYARAGVRTCVRRLRGQKMRSTPDLMNEISAALQFFDGFGENWNALEECLSYLDEWLPADAYVLIVEHAEELLSEQRSDLLAFLRTVDLAGRFLARPIDDNDRFNRAALPFHLLLFAPTDVGVDRMVGAAAEAGVEVRREAP